MVPENNTSEYKKNIQDYSFTQFLVDIKNLSEKIAVKKPKNILAVSTGGLFPAAFLARKLKCNVVKTICLKSYNEKKRGDLLHFSIKGFTEEIENPKDWLIVDDITRTGKTLEFLRNKFKGVPIATIFINPSVNKPDFWARESDKYVRFPWE